MSGRPPRTTHEEISRIALELFATRGFEETSVDDIAAAVGVGRRTVFRYYRTKADIVWGDFDLVTARLREELSDSDPERPAMAALREAVLASNRYPAGQLAAVRLRATLITRVPSLRSHTMLRSGAWRRAVSEWVAERRGEDAHDLIPETVAYSAQGASTAAFTRWVRHPEEDLEACIERAFLVLGDDLGAG